MTNNCNPSTEKIQKADSILIVEADKNSSTASEAIETQIERLCSFFKENKMQLNALKTESVIFSKHTYRGNFKTPIKVGKETIHSSKSMKYLGISMDCDMRFQSEIKLSLRNMATSTRTLNEVRKILPSTTRLVLLKPLY